MKKTVATLAILTLASAMPLAAEAKITPNGTSGIINTPSAFVRSCFRWLRHDKGWTDPSW